MFLISGLFAQEKLTYGEVETQSYKLYLEKDWKALIEYSSKARQQGIDFFYLQARTGIAWYELGKFRRAAPWFLKAYEADNNAEWLQEYLYYSLIFSGMNPEADRLAAGFSQAIKQKTGFVENGIQGVSFETGFSFNSDFDDFKKRDFRSEAAVGNDYGEAYLLKDYQFYSFDLSHKPHKNVLLTHSLTYTAVNREALVDWGEQTNADIRINQFNYYISPMFIIGKKLNISPSLNLILGSGDVYAGGLDRNGAKFYQTTQANYSDAAISGLIWTNLGNTAPGMEFNLADVQDSRFVQSSFWCTFYPISNLRFTVTPKVYFKFAEAESSSPVYGLSASYSSGNITLSAQFLKGEMKNFIEGGGYVVSNFSDESKQKIMLNLYYPVSKKYQFFVRYLNHQMTNNYQVYTSGIKSRSIEYNYNKHTLTGGLLWNF